MHPTATHNEFLRLRLQGLSFARIARLREDKGPAEATTLEELRHLYERQFATKGRA